MGKGYYITNKIKFAKALHRRQLEYSWLTRGNSWPNVRCHIYFHHTFFMNFYGCLILKIFRDSNEFAKIKIAKYPKFKRHIATIGQINNLVLQSTVHILVNVKHRHENN